MGPQRSIAKLRRVYSAETPDGAPSIETLKAWSGRFGWVALSKQFDEEGRGRLIERTQTAVVNREFNRVQMLTEAAAQCLDQANAIVVAASGASASDKATLMRAAIDAMKMVEVLTGGVSDRQERTAGLATEARDLLAQLERKAKARIIDVKAEPVGDTETPALPAPASPHET